MHGKGDTGSLFLGPDTHSFSERACVSELEVLAASEVLAVVDYRNRYTPMPAISHAILTYNRGRTDAMASLIVNWYHDQIATGNDADSDRYGYRDLDAGL
ncbi:hypothetical protein A8144_04745 [Mycobacterium leprae 3125609]|nr:hypothetical protein A8144_04745 [Mycobacterium leprae 3125609]OAX70500.1 hypothetical protein A3216_11695 [Mycobacterium leprae 7935681]